MQVVYISPLGQPVSAELLLGIAIQVLYNLGGHKIRPTPETPGRSQQSLHLRALFWLCYGIDSEFSIRKGQPPMLSDVHCDLDLPVNYTSKSSEHHFYWKPLSSKELLYPSDLRLNLIKSKIYKLLYSEKNASHSEARRIQLIRELDHDLSTLRSEFPVDCRPDLFATENAPDYLFHDLSIRGVSIHLEYYYCLGKIHGANNSYNIPAQDSWSPLQSSAEICYEAARSTLIYVSRVQHIINYHTFWYVQPLSPNTEPHFLIAHLKSQDPRPIHTHGCPHTFPLPHHGSFCPELCPRSPNIGRHGQSLCGIYAIRRFREKLLPAFLPRSRFYQKVGVSSSRVTYSCNSHIDLHIWIGNNEA